LLRLGLWAESRGWQAAAEPAQQAMLNGKVEPFARKVLGKRWKKVSRVAKDLKGGDDEAAHRVRLALKKLRYGTDFFRSLFPGRKMNAYLDAASGLQDRLGHLNDVAVSRALIGRLLERPDGDSPANRQAAGLTIGWHSHAAHRARKTLLKSWRTLERARPF
jgi:CHAD domain-containing protein